MRNHYFSEELLPGDAKAKTINLEEVGEIDIEQTLKRLHNNKTFNVFAELKADDTGEKRVITGYANTKNLDRVDDIVNPSAFRNSLRYIKRFGKVLYHHDPRRPIGKFLDATIDDNGLMIKAEIAQGLTPASYIEEAWSLIKQGVLDAFSIGFRVIEDSMQEKKTSQYRRITKLDLYEVSVVSIPANIQSHFSVVKSLLTPDVSGTVPLQLNIEEIEKTEEEEYQILKKYSAELKAGISELEDEIALETFRREIRQANELLQTKGDC